LLAEFVAPESEAAGALEIGLRKGSLVGRFEILRELGRGGFGVVYEALDPELGRKVAIKMLRPARRALGESERQRLREEAEAVARLDHPSNVTVYDAGTCTSGPYVVLELLRGEPLDVRLSRGPLAPLEALRLATDVAKALAHAHSRGVLHRDLKPANVFLTEDGRTKLVDFGLAHLLGSAERSHGGTPAYMAPDQARGAPTDERADVFAWGVLVYETLEGRRPFEVREGRSAVLDGEAPAPFSLPLPPLIVSFFANCLAADPAMRPRSGQALLEQLLAFQRAMELASDSSGAEMPPTALAKITRPRLPPIFARVRLFRRLDDAPESSPR